MGWESQFSYPLEMENINSIFSLDSATGLNRLHMTPVLLNLVTLLNLRYNRLQTIDRVHCSFSSYHTVLCCLHTFPHALHVECVSHLVLVLCRLVRLVSLVLRSTLEERCFVSLYCTRCIRVEMTVYIFKKK